MNQVKTIFERQLEKCGVDYFDFYLFHNVCEMNIEAYLDPKYGIFDYLTEQKRSGRIRHLGFSAHEGAQILLELLHVGHTGKGHRHTGDRLKEPERPRRDGFIRTQAQWR